MYPTGEHARVADPAAPQPASPAAAGKPLSVALRLDARRTRFTLLTVAALLTALSLGSRLAVLGRGEELRGVPRLTNVNWEQSLPTWWSSLQLAAASALLFASTLRSRADRGRFTRHWAGLSFGFLLMSLDEAASLHERAKVLVPQMARHGVFRFAWVIPGLVLVAILAIVYLRFLGSLPARPRRQFTLAAALFLGGALGMEMVGAAVYDAAMTKDFLGFVLCSHLEELLEMTGVGLFIAALVETLGERLGPRGIAVVFRRD